MEKTPIFNTGRQNDENAMSISMMYSTIVMCTIVLVASAYRPLPHIPPGVLCGKWCRTLDREIYCCDESSISIGPFQFKPGFCPYLQTACSPNMTLTGPPSPAPRMAAATAPTSAASTSV
ncbi:uncharacterized protein LOC143029575 [Oratosquilla oratoria]|uniref:uncharacterized protein LOC143029575 n=1 Tax=Oratosquilla oratoria TaxID=337810 RepID=UPI003F76862C